MTIAEKDGKVIFGDFSEEEKANLDLHVTAWQVSVLNQLALTHTMN